MTLKSGERHSEFCCACGKPGPNDVVSGTFKVVEAPVTIEALPEGADIEHFSRMMRAVRFPLARFRSFPGYEEIRQIEQIQIHEVHPPAPARAVVHDPAVAIAPYRGAAVPGQQYERTVRGRGLAPDPWDAVLSRRDVRDGRPYPLVLEDEETILPRFAPSFLGCLCALFTFRKQETPEFLLLDWHSPPIKAMQAAAFRSVLEEMERGTLERRLRIEARVDENLRGYLGRGYLSPPTTLNWEAAEARAMAETAIGLRRMLRGVPPYRNAGRAIGQICGSIIHEAMFQVDAWSTPEPLVVGDDLWVEATTVTALARVVTAANDDRRRWDPGAVPLRVIIPTMKSVMAIARDLAARYAYDLGPYNILPPIGRPLFDHETAQKLESEIPYDWPRHYAVESERLQHGEHRFQIEDSTWYVGIDPGKTMFLRRYEGEVSVPAIDDTPPFGWSKDEILSRIRAIYAADEQRARRERLQSDVYTTITQHLRSLVRSVEVSVKAPQGIRFDETWVPDGAPPTLPGSAQHRPSIGLSSALINWEGGPLVVFKKRKDNPPSAVPAIPASTAEVSASTFGYAPGERDAYPIGQAPGETFRWPSDESEEAP